MLARGDMKSGICVKTTVLILFDGLGEAQRARTYLSPATWRSPIIGSALVLSLAMWPFRVPIRELHLKRRIPIPSIGYIGRV